MASGSPFESARILIVDDEAANIALLESVLRRAGYRSLHTTEDSGTVPALYAELAPDLVLLDLHMPHPNGIELLEAFRAQTPASDYVPVVILTADATTGATQRALAAGARDVIHKPFDVQEVLLRVRNLLETRFYHRALHERARVATEQAGQALSSAMADFVLRRDIAAVADRIAASVRTLIQAKTAVVYRVEPDTGDLVALAVCARGDAVEHPVLRSPAGSGVGGRAVRTGRPVTTPDVLADPAIELPDDLRAQIADTPLRAAMALPMAIQGHVVGTLALFDEAGRAFTPEEMTVAQAFADQAAVALEMTRIYDETEQGRQVAEKLALVAKGLTETLDVEAIGQQVVAATTSLFQAQTCTLRLLREDGRLQLVAVGGPSSHTMDLPDDMPTGMGVPALVL